ncbi:MAG TPA: aminotransferase class III-fold pyridoxal phosphate-dependent enzyme [Dehalococcoidia bacterium]|nr:aminotransferase class III-fold pyridoxal phosphate-dependent enzyme [Dehalococcoidia bacterium]
MTIQSRYVELHPTSQRLHRRALPVFPDGVTHDMRHTSPFPLYVAGANGSRKRDVDGNELVDFVMGHGALLLGHQYPAVVDAVMAQAALGTHYGASHEWEIRWGESVQRLVPSAERVRFTSSGTEATMMAVRLARAYTGRHELIRLREHFHGWNDSVAGQPHAEETVPLAPGLTPGALSGSIVLPQNDVTTLERTLREDGALIAAVVLEATGAHWGTDPIDEAFVRRARELTAKYGVLLIFDEVITGFRVAPGGAQEVYGVTPDLTTLAKILAGGLPGGCVAGRADVLDQIAFREDAAGSRVSHQGTFNANPLSSAAGTACLEVIGEGTHQQRAAATAALLAQAMNAVFREESVAGAVYGQSSMLHIALGLERQPPDGHSWGWRALPEQPPRVRRAVAEALRLGMINEGVDLMSGGMMVSSAHNGGDVELAVGGLRNTLRAMKAEALVS